MTTHDRPPIDDPRRPAAAYRIMANLLPQPYFLQHPPASGVRLIVVGVDGVHTRWDMSEEMAARITPRLVTNPSVTFKAAIY